MNTVDYDNDRHAMWCSHIPYYPSMPRLQKRNAKIAFAQACGYSRPSLVGWAAQVEKKNDMDLDFIFGRETKDRVNNTYETKVDIFGTFPTFPANAVPTINKKEETNMYNEPQEIDQRRYLERRLDTAFVEADLKLRKHFHINRMHPETVKEVVEKLTTGKFKISDTYLKALEDDYGNDDIPYEGYFLTNLIDWDLEPADKVGYKAASEVLNKVYQDAKDTIMVSSLDNGLQALKAFKDQTFN